MNLFKQHSNKCICVDPLPRVLNEADAHKFLAEKKKKQNMCIIFHCISS